MSLIFLYCRDAVDVDLVISFLRGFLARRAFDIFYELEAELPPGAAAPGKVHTLEFVNHTLKRESPVDPTFYIPISP